MSRVCGRCGSEIAEPRSPSAFESVFTGPSFRRLFADLVFPCPMCGADIARARRYWGFATVGQVKVIIAGFVFAMLSLVLFLVVRE
jgi:hypothetical protein